MIQSIWLATQGQDVTYIRSSRDTEPGESHIIGPFAYTSKEQTQHRSVMSLSVVNPNSLIEIQPTDFVQALFNGFPPSGTDVFSLNDEMFPLTPEGAAWVDAAMGRAVWVPLFNEDDRGNGLTWLDEVLTLVGKKIGLDLEAMRGLGEMIVSQDDEMLDEVQQAQKLVLENVKVAILPELAGEEDPHSFFRLHTVGMNKLDRPELEIRGVPAWWVSAAGAELNAWAAYSLKHTVEPGSKLHGGGPVPLVLQVSPVEDDYWAMRQGTCLRLSVSDVYFTPDANRTLH